MRKMFERLKIQGIRRVSKKELRELSKLPWVLDEAHSDPSWETRVLSDGRVLHILRIDGSAKLFPSREAFDQMLQGVKAMVEEEATKGHFDPAKELLPPLADFIRDVDKLSLGLGKVLHIPEEALDRSVESLDLVDRALLRVTIAKRMTPEVFTPVTAYLGEVMRLVCDGRWGKLPATIKKKGPTYDPADYKAWATAAGAVVRAAGAAADKAAADASMRGAGDRAAARAFYKAYDYDAVVKATSASSPKILGYEEYEEPIHGHEHEPVIWAHDGALVQPVASVVRSLSERSTYGTLRTAVEGKLHRYLVAKRKAAGAGGERS
jgi:hypothetical protein